MIWTVLWLVGCGAPRGGAAPQADGTGAPSALAGVARACAWRVYHAPAGCYVDDSLRLPQTLADEAALAGILRRLPPDPHVRHPACDPAEQAAAFDFARSRVFLCEVPGDSRPAQEPIRVECGDDATRVFVSSQAAAQCGRGDDIGTSVMMLVVPAGAVPVERVEEGSCDFDPGVNPPP